MAEKPDVKALVETMPDLDSRKDKKGKVHTTGKLTGPKWPDAEKVYEAILDGGREAVAAVVDLLEPIDDGRDYKARYVLAGLAAFVCRDGREKHRAVYDEALASRLGGDRPKPVRAFLLRQLQTAGDKSAVAAAGKLLLDEDLCEPAAQALVAIDPKAAGEALRRALPRADGPRRLTIVQGLGVVADAASARALREALGDADREVRIAAGWSLARLGEDGSVEALMKAADAKDRWERIQAARACLLLAEKLRAAGKGTEAARLYKHLRDTRRDESERYLREAAERALAPST